MTTGMKGNCFVSNTEALYVMFFSFHIILHVDLNLMIFGRENLKAWELEKFLSTFLAVYRVKNHDINV